MNRRNVRWGVATLALTLLLTSAVYTAVRLWATQDTLLEDAEVEPAAQISSDGLAVSLSHRIQRAAELPERDADAAGIFLRRQDNAIVIGTGAVHMNVDMSLPDRPVVPSHEGPEIEIVPRRGALIFRDDTEAAGQTGTVQQVVSEVTSLEEVDALTYISAWGTRRGERLIADLLVYSPER